MQTTIDGAGRIVIPKSIRDRLGLHGGEQVDVTERDGTIEITPASATFRLVERHDGTVVAVADQDLPPLTDEAVREVLERTRR